ncbi:hypothetical protein O0I10_004158 [Lichtheimia ornata]|uniref:Uncharacterized protein n=1 Tax=Lichtheimia ornata TaxID=688661 RepID=A0AAD7Y275_9FUNG|nr:uncharacterized protein O0I10_004158 [Lichtheimia ornata]KAJ8659932.1 hypothetical protein O0I10_004158 [Lichtheimia ornata]
MNWQVGFHGGVSSSQHPLNADSSRVLTDAVSIATTTASTVKRNNRGAHQTRTGDPCGYLIDQESNHDPPMAEATQ